MRQFIGFKEKLLTTYSTAEKCTVCSRNHLEIELYQKILTFFFLPITSSGKTAYLRCKNCGLYRHEAFFIHSKNNAIEKSIECGKAKYKTPLWSYTGIILIALIAGFQGYRQHYDSKKIFEFIDHPNGNFLFIIKASHSGHFPYVIGKMKSVKNGHIEMVIGNYSFSNLDQAIREIKSIKKDPEKNEHFFSKNISMSEKRFQKLNIQQVLCLKNAR